MTPGETFFGFDFGNHLWIVLSHPTPAGKVAVVNVTTHGRTPLCARGECVLIQPGEHAFVTRPSCLYLRGAVLAPEDPLDEAKRRGMLQQHQPLSHALLHRLQSEAVASRYVSREVAEAVASSKPPASQS